MGGRYLIGRYGDSIIATAPVGLAALILSAITPAAPVAAVSLSAGIVHKTLAGRCLAMISSAAIGVFVGLCVQYFGSKSAIDKGRESDKRKALIRLRPLLAYMLLILGLIRYTYCCWAASSLASKANALRR